MRSASGRAVSGLLALAENAPPAVRLRAYCYILEHAETDIKVDSKNDDLAFKIDDHLGKT